MSGIQETRKTVPVAEVQTGKLLANIYTFLKIWLWGTCCEFLLTLTPLPLKVSDRAEHLGSGLLHRGLKPNSNTFIGIFAQNRPEVGGFLVSVQKGRLS